MLDRYPAANQGIKAIVQRFEGSERLNVCGMRQRQVDGLDVLGQPIANPPEFRQQPHDPFGHRQMLRTPVLQRSTDLVGDAVRPLEQSEQRDMWVDLDQPTWSRPITGHLQPIAERLQLLPNTVGDRTGPLNRWAVNGATSATEDP